MELSGKHIVLGLTGGIACYKAAELCRCLTKEGATVQVVMTEAATRFITPVTMQALSGRPVALSQWDAREPDNMAHIRLGRGADAILVAPCSADFIARLAAGRSDELLSLLCLARPRASTRLLLAPAMNREMWTHPATLRNVDTIQEDGAVVLPVGHGDQACGETGDGRMLEPAEILEELVAHFQPKLLAGCRVLITAGPTQEAIDPVRCITNHSSGKMGFAIARAAWEAGAEVTLVAGPVALATPRGVRRINVVTAEAMFQAVMAEADAADLFIATAAVADWRPATTHLEKLKKVHVASMEVPRHADAGHPTALAAIEPIALMPNRDILHAVAHSSRALSGALVCVGFAAESHDLARHAEEKRLRKGVALMVGNIGPTAFGQDDNELLFIDADGAVFSGRKSKLALARELIAKTSVLVSAGHTKKLVK